MTTARPTPPATPTHGTATSQPWLFAYATVTSDPSVTPITPPEPASNSHGEELAHDVAARRPQRPPQSDLEPPLQHGHQHDVA